MAFFVLNTLHTPAPKIRGTEILIWLSGFSRLNTAVAATNGKVDLAIVDVDELADLSIDYGVEAVPTVHIFKNGKSVDKFSGLVDDDILDSFIKKAMGWHLPRMLIHY